MDKILELISPDSSLMEAMDLFFKDRSLSNIQEIFWKLFKCWSMKECHQTISLSDEEVALFYDQLIELLSTAHLVYQASRQNDSLSKSR